MWVGPHGSLKWFRFIIPPAFSMKRFRNSLTLYRYKITLCRYFLNRRRLNYLRKSTFEFNEKELTICKLINKYNVQNESLCVVLSQSVFLLSPQQGPVHQSTTLHYYASWPLIDPFILQPRTELMGVRHCVPIELVSNYAINLVAI